MRAQNKKYWIIRIFQLSVHPLPIVSLDNREFTAFHLDLSLSQRQGTDPRRLDKDDAEYHSFHSSFTLQILEERRYRFASGGFVPCLGGAITLER